MADLTPVTRQDLVKSVTGSLGAQQRLRDAMAQVSAEVAAAKAAPAASAAPK